MPSLSIQLLGGFHIDAAGKNIEGFHQPRLQVLLAYLLLHRGVPVPRQTMAFTFWPDSSDAQARTNLRKLLFALRRGLPKSDDFLALTTETVTLRADADYQLDVAQVEAAWCAAESATQRAEAIAARRRAVAAYGGDLLSGHYDEWILAERERLRRGHIAALEALVTDLAATGDHAAAIDYAHQLVQQDPLHESSYRRLMQVHLDRDDRAAALHVYHSCASILREELGADPSPATDALYYAALQGPGSDTPATPALTGIVPLVGRGGAWQRLQRAWQAAASGHPHMVLLLGEAGIGKTRLAEELADLVRHQGHAALYTRVFEARGAGAYAPLAALLRAAPVRRGVSTLDPLWQGELARLLPDLLSAGSALPAPAPISEEWQRLRFHEALARACLSAPSPLLLHMDDLQWADAETLDWLHFLIHFEPSARLLLVCTARDEEVGASHPLQRVMRDLQHSGHCSLIDLAPLPTEDVAVLASAVSGDAWTHDAAASLFSLTQGNPLFVVETLRAGELTAATPQGARSASDLPPKVHAVLAQRLAQLSPPARQLARVAAVIGTGFDFGLLAASTPDLSDAGIVAGLDELWRRRILQEDAAGGYDFSHDRLRDVAYDEIGPGARVLLHGSVAAALVARAGPEGDALSGRIAVHAEQAGRRDLAAEHYRRAGDHAARAFAHDDALHQYERSLACLDSGGWETEIGVRLGLEQVYDRTADPVARLANLQALQALVDRFPANDEDRARMELGWAAYYRQVDDSSQAVARTRRAAALARTLNRPLLEAAADFQLGDGLWNLGRLEEARTALSRAAQTAHDHDDPPMESRALEVLAACGMFSGMAEADLARHLHRCRNIHERHGDLYGQISIDNKLGFLVAAQGEGDYGAAIQRYLDAIEVAQRIAAARQETLLTSNLGWVYMLDGDYAAAAQFIHRGRELARTTHAHIYEAIAMGFQAELAFNAGDSQAAFAQFAAALEQVDSFEGLHRRTRLLLHMGLCRLWDGAPAGALAYFTQALKTAEALHDTRFEAWVRVGLGHTHLALGDLDAAEAHYAAAWTLRRDLGMVNRGMEAVAGLADVAWRRQDIPQTCTHLDTVVTHVIQHRLDRTEEPLRMLATTHRLLTALDDPRAAAVYGLAHAQLHRRAATLDDAARDRFWRTPLHAAFAAPGSPATVGAVSNRT